MDFAPLLAALKDVAFEVGRLVDESTSLEHELEETKLENAQLKNQPNDPVRWQEP